MIAEKVVVDEKIEEIVNYIKDYVKNNEGKLAKEIKPSLVKKFKEKFSPQKDGAVYYFSKFSIRFSSVDNGEGGSNTVCGLRKILKHDDNPCISCVIRPQKVDFSLMNSTFIKKVSHSSPHLDNGNIRGSINLSDIFMEYDKISNTLDNFDELFPIHMHKNQENNIERIIKATKNINPNGVKYCPTKEEKKRISMSSVWANKMSKDKEYLSVANKLKKKVENEKDKIIKIAEIDNVNTRGNNIEKIITGLEPSHDLFDMIETIYDLTSMGVGIKTKVLSKNSNPTLYSVDKMLKFLAEGYNLFSLFIIMIDIEKKEIKTCLVSILDKTIIEATTIQQHWSSKNKRGHAQLRFDKCEKILNEIYSEYIDIKIAKTFLKNLIKM